MTYHSKAARHRARAKAQRIRAFNQMFNLVIFFACGLIGILSGLVLVKLFMPDHPMLKTLGID